MTARDLVLPSFFGDALALGPHWIYDPVQIAAWYPGGIRAYEAPRSQYHPATKAAGDFTHYGDQALALLESLAGAGGSLENWPADWLRWAERIREDKSSYLDGATRGTLQNLAAGVAEPSPSSDLGGAARIAPLLAFHRDVEQLVPLARAQTALTHGDPQVIDAAEFFARAAVSVAGGAGFEEAFDEAASHPYDALPAIDWGTLGRDASSGDLAAKAGALGLGCDIDGAFPITLALAFRYEADPVEALSANAMLGGDSAARGLLLGLLMGARHGAAAFPAEWISGLRSIDAIERALP
ncbi:ADP-ribosylglycohydrolase family protein [Luteolibacter flavescens]|uniref:ADP-ribosylglycohydrolase family protein n=1 Tax=Luteolibacter flavescens TaxID=1859460 RepID=A0ABT3FU46_9BACT|nr:ADP-ribosylglycohydrolase family protein [Luteolibacter flavescens]MCW1887111.1 ADP-ribosylglycohydrolase family protein [Luteolibacter flavescens]